MPFKSQAQRRKFHEMARSGEMPYSTVMRWEQETGGRWIPERVTPKQASWQIRPSPIHGRGLFATTDIPQGATVGTVFHKSGAKLAEAEGRFINYSSTPNIELFMKEGDVCFRTLRLVKQGEELVGNLSQLKTIAPQLLAQTKTSFHNVGSDDALRTLGLYVPSAQWGSVGTGR